MARVTLLAALAMIALSLWGAPAPMPVVRVEGGSYVMGADTAIASNEMPAHRVTVSEFLMGATEVTIEAFSEFVQATGYISDCEKPGETSFVYNGDDMFLRRPGMTWRKTKFPQQADFPVVSVSWHDAVAFANWRSAQDGLSQAYAIEGRAVRLVPGAKGWRLPTEAEWEYAARGGTQSRGYAFAGSDNEDAASWNYSNSGFRSHPVGQKLPNELGLFDMSGNVQEWCQDWFGPYAAGEATDPAGPVSGTFKATRGGNWITGHMANRSMRPSARSFEEPGYAYNNLGFRLVRNP